MHTWSVASRSAPRKTEPRELAMGSARVCTRTRRWPPGVVYSSAAWMYAVPPLRSRSSCRSVHTTALSQSTPANTRSAAARLTVGEPAPRTPPQARLQGMGTPPPRLSQTRERRSAHCCARPHVATFKSHAAMRCSIPVPQRDRCRRGVVGRSADEGLMGCVAANAPPRREGAKQPHGAARHEPRHARALTSRRRR